jgi:hypothetical protein
MNQRRSRDKQLAALAITLLFAACAAPEDQTPTPATPLATMPAELEMVVRQLDGAGPAAAPIDRAAIAAAIRARLGALADRVFVAALDGGEEVPPVDTRASAVAALLLVNPAAGDVVLALIHNVTNANAAHIHRGAGGQNGPIIVPLDASRAVILAQARLTPDQVADLQAGRLYANVHSTAFPRGEIRGQLLHLGETLFTALLSGANEVPPRDTPATGSLAVILNHAGDSLTYEGTFSGLTAPATAAHIHTGVAGANGPVRFPLTIAGSTLAGVQAVTAEDVATLDAEGLYTNVHSATFPAGEIRGQLGRR